MADLTETVTLRLQEQISGPADAAESALSNLKASIAAAGDAMRETQSKIASLKLSNLADAGPQIEALTATLADDRNAVSDLQQSYIALGGSATSAMSAAKAGVDGLAKAEAKAAQAAKDLQTAGKSAGDATKGVGDGAALALPPMGALAKEVKMLGGSLGAGESKMIRFAGAFMKLGPEVAIVVAAIVLLVAGIAAFVSAVAFGISSAGAFRNELLHLEVATKGNVRAARDIQDAITAVATSSALGRDKITGYAEQLAYAGLKGDVLKRAIEAASIAGSAGGDEIANGFIKAAIAAKGSVAAVDALSSKMKKELGGIAAKQALSLDAQMNRLHESIAYLFSGADIEPFLNGLHAVLSIFDANSTAAKSLREQITSMVNAAIGWMLRLEIVMLQTYIAIKSNSLAWGMVKAALWSVAIVMGLIVASVAVLVVLLAVAVAGFMLPFALMAGAVMLVVDAVEWVGDKIGEFYDWLTSLTWEDVGKAIATALLFPVIAVKALGSELADLWDSATSIDWGAIGDSIMNAISGAWSAVTSIDWGGLGSAIIDGIVSGLSAGASAVVSALSRVASGALDAAKSVLGIHSPSKVFMQIGAHVATGMAQGIDAGAGDVAASGANLASGAAKGAASEAVQSTPPAAGKSVTFNNCSFGAGLTQEMVYEWMRLALESDSADASTAGAPG